MTAPRPRARPANPLCLIPLVPALLMLAAAGSLITGCAPRPASNGQRGAETQGTASLDDLLATDEGQLSTGNSGEMASPANDATRVPKPDPSTLEALAQAQAQALSEAGRRTPKQNITQAAIPDITSNTSGNEGNNGASGPNAPASAALLRAQALPPPQNRPGRLSKGNILNPQALEAAGDAAWSDQVVAPSAPSRPARADVPHNVTGNVTGTLTTSNETRAGQRPNATRSAMAGEAANAPDDDLIELAKRMARLLREPATQARPKMPDATALAAIESLRPGSLANVEDVRSTLGSGLSASDRKTLVDARERLAAQPGQATQDVTKALETLSPAPTLTITRSALCTRVLGFGKYNAYASSTFPVGQPIRAIVYIELDNFTSRAAKDSDPGLSTSAPDQQAVELSQALSLYNNADDLLIWRKPPQTIIEVGHRARRDFYLIQQIELPRTLGVGKYYLKVHIIDRTNNAQSEAVLPIYIVAG